MHSSSLHTSIARLNEISGGLPYIEVRLAAPLVGMAPNTLRNRSQPGSKHPLPFGVINGGARGTRLLVHVDSLRDYLMQLEARVEAALLRSAESVVSSIHSKPAAIPTKQTGKSISGKIRDGFARGVETTTR